MDALSRVPPTPLALSDASVDRVAGWFDVHYLRLSRLARRMTNSADDALDLVQETFLRASRHVSSVPRDPTGEEAWLVRTLVNIRRDQWRRMATRKQYDLGKELESRVHEPGPENAVIARTTVWRALDILPPRRRAVLVMRELEDLDVAQIAVQLGISRITVRWHLTAAKRDLAKILTTSKGLL